MTELGTKEQLATPKTDAVTFYVVVMDEDYGNVRQCVVDREFARAQEREIDRLQAALREAQQLSIRQANQLRQMAGAAMRKQS